MIKKNEQDIKEVKGKVQEDCEAIKATQQGTQSGFDGVAGKVDSVEDGVKVLFGQISRVDQELKDLTNMFLEIKKTALTRQDCTTVKDMHENVQWCVKELQVLRSGKGKGTSSRPGEVGGDTSHQVRTTISTTRIRVGPGANRTTRDTTTARIKVGTDTCSKI